MDDDQFVEDAMTGPTLAPMTAADLDEVLDLNQRSVPHVGDLDRDRLQAILSECSLAIVARTGPAGSPGADRAGGPLVGFVLVLAPGASYDSPNYRYFADAYEDFRYVDRIAIDPTGHRGGLGRRLYEAVFRHARLAGAPVVTAEVNLVPPNPVSQSFHEALGFVEVGRQDTYGGAVTVQLLARPI